MPESTIVSRKSDAISHCLFCDPKVVASAVAGNALVYALRDTSPVTPGHTLVIPRRHRRDYFDMTAAERRAADALLDELHRAILSDDPTVGGFNVGVNCGVVAGQTIFHAHIHLIPRRAGDTPFPRGGVRGVIPDKMAY